MYVAYYDLTSERGQWPNLMSLSISCGGPELLYDFMREHAADVEWD